MCISVLMENTLNIVNDKPRHEDFIDTTDRQSVKGLFTLA